MLEKRLLILFSEHRGKTIGILAGLALSILFLNFGFWRALFIIICVGLGYFIGKKLDENYNFEKLMKQLFRDKEL